jgi:outer membrane protein assembly factor BamB
MRRAAVLSLVLLLLAAAAASGAPRVVPGWPVVAPSGDVFPGPGGGAVVIGATEDADVTTYYAASALRPNGKLLWRNVRVLDCGNCDFGQTPTALQPDGTYGPIGATGDDFWAVTRTGRRVDGCADVTLANGTCIATRPEFTDLLSPPRWTVVARRGGAVVWRYEEPGFSAEIQGDVAPAVVADGAGRVYTALGPPDVLTQSPRLLALDAASGALQWRRLGDLRPLAGLEEGVLARDGRSLVAIGPGGQTLWTTNAVPLASATPRVLLDAKRHVLYVGTGRTVVALDSRTGAVRWRTGTAESALPLSVTDTGVLLAVARKTRREARAHTAAGRLIWRYRTATDVEGALALDDGTAVVSTADDLVTRIDPRRRAPRVRRARVTLSPRRIRTACADVCGVPPLSGTTLRMALPRAAVLVVRVRTGGRVQVGPLRIATPAGLSATRILADRPLYRLRNGKRLYYRSAVVEVRWRAGGRGQVRRFPISVTPPPR